MQTPLKCFHTLFSRHSFHKQHPSLLQPVALIAPSFISRTALQVIEPKFTDKYRLILALSNNKHNRTLPASKLLVHLMARKATHIQLKIIFMKASIFNSWLLVVLKCWALDSSRLRTQTAFYATAFHSHSSCHSVRRRVFKSGELQSSNAKRKCFFINTFPYSSFNFLFNKLHSV